VQELEKLKARMQELQAQMPGGAGAAAVSSLHPDVPTRCAVAASPDTEQSPVSDRYIAL